MNNTTNFDQTGQLRHGRLGHNKDTGEGFKSERILKEKAANKARIMADQAHQNRNEKKPPKEPHINL